MAAHAYSGGEGPPAARSPHPGTPSSIPRRALYGILKEGITAYTGSFGADAAEMVLLPSRIKITTREMRDGRWNPAGKVEVIIVPEIPGFRIERGEYSTAVELGLLPSNKLFYRDREQDVYLTMEDLTKRILDRLLFPKLKE